LRATRGDGGQIGRCGLKPGTGSQGERVTEQRDHPIAHDILEFDGGDSDAGRDSALQQVPADIIAVPDLALAGMGRKQRVACCIDHLAGEQARACGAFPSSMPAQIVGESDLDAIPYIALDDAHVVALIDVPVVMDFADIGRAFEQAVDLTAAKWHAAKDGTGLRTCAGW
jgi:hypothetical protein